MTTTTDSAGHPDVAEISDLTEGLLSPSRTLDVRRHLDDCPLCTDVYESLEEIRGMLGTLPGPPRMPTDVAERIDAALAAEALLDATVVVTEAESAAGDAAVATAASTRETVAEPTAHVTRETSTTATAKPTPAATASAASSASAAHGPDTRGPAGHPRAASGPGRSSRLRGSRRRTTVLGAVFTAAALGLGALLIQPWNGDSKKPSNSASAGNDSTFSKGKLGGQVSELLSEEQAAAAGTDGGSSQPSYDVRSSPGEKPPKSSKMRDSYVEVPACVEQGLGGRTPLASDKGTYEGKTAYLVVVPHDSDSAKVSAYVIDGTCVASAAPDDTGKVLLTESYAKP
ncbi:anti-sigma factor family protein [Streptomyces lasiicapitis]|uniref:anti-sigma factor family protein n=1 Tax=Streptomyces lasiicapitis TaxID=1923961 RepID=UPI00367F330E